MFALGMVLDIPGPDGAHLKVAGNHLKMSGRTNVENRFPPKFGQDTRDVLTAELPISPDELASQEKAGVVKLTG